MRKPATMVGIFVGLLAGALAAIKEAAGAKFPVVGIVIAVLTPAVIFVFEQLMRMVFPDVYREKVAGKIYFLWRWLLNESFSLRFFYDLHFPDGTLPNVTAICDAIGAGPDKDPRADSMTINTVHLQYRNVSNYIVVKWSRLPVDDASLNSNGITHERVFDVTLAPAVRRLSIRSAPEQLAGMNHTINELRNQLVSLIGNPVDECAVADVWLGETEPSKWPLPATESDKVIDADVRHGNGWVQITGKGSSILSAAYRHLKILEPPPRVTTSG